MIRRVRSVVGEGAVNDQPSVNSATEQPGGTKPSYTAEEKMVCSIEAMRRGEACEACQ